MKRIVVLAITCLLALPNPALACPGARFNQKPFDPTVGVKYFIDTNIAAYDPLLAQCLGQGLDLWNGPNTPVRDVAVHEANVHVILVPASELPGAGNHAQGQWANQLQNPAGFVESGAILIPDNIVSMAGLHYGDGEGCNRIKRLAAHEISHGYFGTEHTMGSVLQGGDEALPWGGLRR